MAKMKSVGEICQLINGYAFKPSDWSTEGTPIVRIQNLNNESAEFNYFKGELDKKYYIDSGTLLFSWSGTPGTSFGAFLWDRGRARIDIVKSIAKFLRYRNVRMSVQKNISLVKRRQIAIIIHMTMSGINHSFSCCYNCIICH